ncbi:hypothetical protein [Arthrobacter sp. YC-RL1]|uniref:hypothetical protein n=1 Tax=Arthrobacter sp. YC-RL1 TaxID=1652545 RepID=UPI000A480AE5|nr:hypothetical protein [Arthrobacter sp. YC-RL1]
MTRNASEIYDDLKALANELEELGKTGRITMSTDSWNKDYPDTKPAVAQALAALQVAINATCWMENPARSRSECDETRTARLSLLPTCAQQKPYPLRCFSCTHVDSRNQSTARTQATSWGP